MLPGSSALYARKQIEYRFMHNSDILGCSFLSRRLHQMSVPARPSQRCNDGIVAHRRIIFALKSWVFSFGIGTNPSYLYFFFFNKGLIFYSLIGLARRCARAGHSHSIRMSVSDRFLYEEHAEAGHSTKNPLWLLHHHHPCFNVNFVRHSHRNTATSAKIMEQRKRRIGSTIRVRYKL